MPDPREPDFQLKATERIRRVLEITQGRAFCLFTSYKQMREVHDRLLAELPYPLLLHGTVNSPATSFSRNSATPPTPSSSAPPPSGREWTFRASSSPPSSSTVSPSPSPPTPSSAPAWLPSKPSAASPSSTTRSPTPSSPSKQGFGRLYIRSLSDRGVLMLLDPRIQRQRYGRIFLDSLPPYRLTQEITDVEAFFTQTKERV